MAACLDPITYWVMDGGLAVRFTHILFLLNALRLILVAWYQ